MSELLANFLRKVRVYLHITKASGIAMIAVGALTALILLLIQLFLGA